MQIDLHDIVTREFQQQMQSSFARLSGFGVVFTDTEGRHIGQGGNFTRFCHSINCSEKGMQMCAQTNRQAIQMSLDAGGKNRPAIFVCHANLVNIELPIMHEGVCIGAFTAGQVKCEEDCYPRDSTAPLADWLNDPQLAAYYEEIPVFSRAHIENTAEMMSDLAEYMLSNYTQSLMQKELAKRKEELLLFEKRQVELEHTLTKTKLAALQRQVMPHFIFNVLNSVSRLVSMGEHDQAQSMLTAFTQMLRYQLSDPQQSVTLGQELDYVRNYLDIQKQRFGARVACSIQCDASLHELHLPFFSLQPLVENSLNHGILGKEKGGRVEICCQRVDGFTRIEVRDDGVGMDVQRLAWLDEMLREPNTGQNHVGLHNCYQRLKLMYGEDIRFEVESEPEKGTAVRILLQEGAPRTTADPPAGG